MVAAAELSFTDLIDDEPDAFQVHSDAYMDAEVLDAEMRRIFERTWVYVGHESRFGRRRHGRRAYGPGGDPRERPSRRMNGATR